MDWRVGIAHICLRVVNVEHLRFLAIFQILIVSVRIPRGIHGHAGHLGTLLRWMTMAVLAHVKEDLLAVAHNGTRRHVEFCQLVPEFSHLSVELLEVPPHAVHGDLGNEQVLGLCSALHAHATCDELLDCQLPAVVVVQENEDLFRIVNWKVDHLQLVVDLWLVDGVLHLLYGQGAASICICRREDLAQLAKDHLPIAITHLPLLHLVLASCSERCLHNNTHDNIQEAEAGDTDEN
mmetsp:Transcript_81172/g.173722  ORF Transcript_81172/g.173722 Transcript_81172/m.173722 type:complete len:236 (+) Transcript_81172:345-1052(+)